MSSSSSNLASDMDVGALAQSFENTIIPSQGPISFPATKADIEKYSSPKPKPKTRSHPPLEDGYGYTLCPESGYAPWRESDPHSDDEDYPAKSIPRHCDDCGLVHNPFHMCYNKYCVVCYSKRHPPPFCPCFQHISQGAEFNTFLYELTCRCGFPFFDPEKWACTLKPCNSTDAKVRLKTCEICKNKNTRDNRHTTFDCPVDKVRSASLRAKIFDVANSGTVQSIDPMCGMVYFMNQPDYDS